MKNKKMPIFVGLSVNANIVFVFSASPQEEKVLGTNFNIELSGSSANIARALDTHWGAKVTLLGVTGINVTDRDVVLATALHKTDISFKKIPVLSESNVAGAICNEQALIESQSVGFRGSVLLEFLGKAIEEITQTVEGELGFKVASGITPEQFLLAKAFLDGNSIGYRSLCPHKFFVREKEHRENLFTLFEHTDLLILNRKEFLSLGTSYSELHNKGISLIVITEGDKGGEYSLSGQIGVYNAFKQEGRIYGTGAGDWFHSAIVFYLREVGANFKDVTFSQFERAIDFARKVSGKKVLYPDAGAGPKLNEIDFEF